jgi:hypothetical protein
MVPLRATPCTCALAAPGAAAARSRRALATPPRAGPLDLDMQSVVVGTAAMAAAAAAIYTGAKARVRAAAQARVCTLTPAGVAGRRGGVPGVRFVGCVRASLLARSRNAKVLPSCVRRTALSAACCPGAGGVRCFVCTGSGKVAPQAPSDADSRGARVCQQRRARARRLTPRVAHGRSNAHAGPGAARAGRVPRVQGHGCAFACCLRAPLRTEMQTASERRQQVFR